LGPDVTGPQRALPVPACAAPYAALVLASLILGMAADPAIAQTSRQPEAAAGAPGRLVQADIKRADDLVNRGNAHADKKEYDRAIADFTQAIELDPQNAYAYNSRADTLREVGKAAEGLPDAEKALKLDSNNAEFWDTRAQIFEALGRRQEAIADYRRALELDPMMTETRERLKRLGASP
jgi:tetratricopeptide (TPR) repeat protein